MSKEFGDDHYHSTGFFHDKIEQAAEVALEGRLEVTQMVGWILKTIYPLADTISAAEAYDSSEAQAILCALENIEAIRLSVLNLEQYLTQFREVIREALQQKIDAPKTS